nr:hypothetical protein JVH1_6675 [Rhodococcus sp. JVH1]
MLCQSVGDVAQEWTDLHTHGWTGRMSLGKMRSRRSIPTRSNSYAGTRRSRTATGVVTDDGLGTFRRATQILGLAGGDVAALDAELARQHMLTGIRSGQLPTVRSMSSATCWHRPRGI